MRAAVRARVCERGVRVKYLLMIYHDEAATLAKPPQELAAIRDAYWSYLAELEAAGVWHEHQALQPSKRATTVRVRDGRVLRSDGPFTESKELVGGYYAIDVPDLDAALAWAANIPSVHEGAVEVRPIVDMTQGT